MRSHAIWAIRPSAAKLSLSHLLPSERGVALLLSSERIVCGNEHPSYTNRMDGCLLSIKRCFVAMRQQRFPSRFARPPDLRLMKLNRRHTHFRLRRANPNLTRLARPASSLSVHPLAEDHNNFANDLR